MHMVGAGLGCREVAHHGVLLGVLDVFGVAVIGDVDAGTGVVVARMLQADGVTDLVDQPRESRALRRPISLFDDELWSIHTSPASALEEVLPG